MAYSYWIARTNDQCSASSGRMMYVDLRIDAAA
jgi:hypothetical protein